VSVGDDNRILVWNIPEGTIRHELAQLSISILHVKFSPDGSFIAASSGQPVLRIWNTEDGTPYRTLEAEANIYSLAFSPDGMVIAGGPAIVEAFVGTPLARIAFWDVDSGGFLGTITEATTAIEMSFSQDNSLLFSVRANPPAVVIWSATDGEMLQELTGHTDSLWGFALNDAGTMIATKSRDGEIIVWGLPQE
jgi:WD40 repeat protein